MTTQDSHKEVMIIDDDDGVRKSLKSVLQTYGYRVATYCSVKDAIKSLKSRRPACIVLDVRMPEIDGLAAQRLLSDSGETVPVIFITGHGDVLTAVTAMKHGAVDFLEKPIDDEKLAAAIKLAVMPRRSSTSATSNELHGRFNELTAREKAVADLVVEGYSSSAIGLKLQISPRTVDHHRANILAKMQATSLPQLIRFLMLVRG